MARTSLPAQADEAQPEAEPQPPQTAAAEAAAPASLTAAGVAVIVRVITLVCLILTVSLLASNSTTITAYNTTFTTHFSDIYAYRYALSSAVIGLSYTSLHLLSSLQQLTTTKSPTNNPKIPVYHFLGDKVILGVLATGVGAIFGATVDLKEKMDTLENLCLTSNFVSKFDDFFNKAYFPAIFLLIAFLTSGVSSVLSSLALIKSNT